jgi:hypothetical protein
MNSTGVTFRSPYGSTFQNLVPVSWFSIQAIYQPDFTQTGLSFETRNLLLRCLFIIAQIFYSYFVTTHTLRENCEV